MLIDGETVEAGEIGVGNADISRVIEGGLKHLKHGRWAGALAGSQQVVSQINQHLQMGNA
eukprot:1162133-Pelagomonas_calceolata.AAC.6